MRRRITVDAIVEVNRDCCGVGSNKCDHLHYEMPEEYCDDIINQRCELFNKELVIVSEKDFEFKRCRKCINKTNAIDESRRGL